VISVIIPAYNVEDYIAVCLDSVTRQTYRDFEVIVVDDGSKDDTPRIAEDAASRDPRIRVVRGMHSHAWAARNVGIDHARGEYISFLDADDLLHPRALETMLAAAERHRATTVMAGYCESLPDAPSVVVPRPLRTEPDRVMGPRRALRAFVRGELRVAVWSALYRSTQFRTLRFANEACTEDAFFMPALLAKSSRTVAIAPCLYHYKRRVGSITYTLSPCWVRDIAAKIELYHLCRTTFPPGKLRAISVSGIITSAWALSLWVVEAGAEISAWRRRIHRVLPRLRLVLLYLHPLISLRAKVLGGSLLLGLRPNAWISRHLRSVYHLLRRRPTR
jgi:glycosyltransferase involved in cell wall biosynthesis